jgi:Family of unknown function (DUF5343)
LNENADRGTLKDVEMANKYPYVASAGPLSKTMEHLRRSFPREVTADTLRKLGVAPKNESYVINVLRFLGVIDEEGKKVDTKSTAFVQHKDEAFAAEFEKLVKDAYGELFGLHGDGAWRLDRGGLVQFFRTSDHSSQVVGTRQAGTFSYLAGLSGHGQTPANREVSTQRKSRDAKPVASIRAKSPTASRAKADAPNMSDHGPKFGLTVRIEVNLPAEGDQQTYDRIFRSIRKNLIDGE